MEIQEQQTGCDKEKLEDTFLNCIRGRKRVTEMNLTKIVI